MLKHTNIYHYTANNKDTFEDIFTAVNFRILIRSENLMAKQIKPLSSTQCDSAKPKEKDYNLYDGQGLILFVRKNGSKV
jgi:hypothetical protein